MLRSFIGDENTPCIKLCSKEHLRNSLYFSYLQGSSVHTYFVSKCMFFSSYSTLCDFLVTVLCKNVMFLGIMCLVCKVANSSFLREIGTENGVIWQAYSLKVIHSWTKRVRLSSPFSLPVIAFLEENALP